MQLLLDYKLPIFCNEVSLDSRYIKLKQPVRFSLRFTCILEGVLTSKVADALKEKSAKGPDNVVEFTIERLAVSIVWLILFTFNKGVAPAA